MKKPFKVIVSFVTLVAFLFNTVSYDLAWAVNEPAALTSVGAAGPGGPGSPKELRIETFMLPPHLGIVQYAKKAPDVGLGTVIHIQDAHCNYPAQKKIAQIIDYLHEEYGVKMVNLEGGTRDYQLAIFTVIDDKTLREKISDEYVGEGTVSGAEYYAINNPEKVKLWGIEDPRLYLENLNAYRGSLKYKDEVDRDLKALSHILSNLKLHIYPKPLMDFDSKYSQYKADNLPFKDYLRALVAKAKESAIDVKSFRNIYLLSQALDEEGSIDFKLANSQRDELIDKLEKRLSKVAMEELIVKTVEFKSDRVSQKDYYAYLTDKARSIGVDLSAFPMLRKYTIYISMYEAVDKSRTMAELEILEDGVRNALTTTDDERELAVLSKNLSIMKNFFNISITRSDYDYYKKNSDSFAMSRYVSFIEKEAPRFKIAARPDKDIAKVDGYRSEMAQFYEYSFLRDDAFIKNLIFTQDAQRPTHNGKDLAILVTGGFHTDNLRDLFIDKGISYISVLPNFRNEEGYQSKYYNLLQGKLDPVQEKIKAALPAALAIASFLNSLSDKRARDAFDIDVALRLARDNKKDGVEFRYGDRVIAIALDGSVVQKGVNFMPIDLAALAAVKPAAAQAAVPTAAAPALKAAVVSPGIGTRAPSLFKRMGIIALMLALPSIAMASQVEVSVADIQRYLNIVNGTVPFEITAYIAVGAIVLVAASFLLFKSISKIYDIGGVRPVVRRLLFGPALEGGVFGYALYYASALLLKFNGLGYSWQNSVYGFMAIQLFWGVVSLVLHPVINRADYIAGGRFYTPGRPFVTYIRGLLYPVLMTVFNALWLPAAIASTRYSELGLFDFSSSVVPLWQYIPMAILIHFSVNGIVKSLKERTGIDFGYATIGDTSVGVSVALPAETKSIAAAPAAADIGAAKRKVVEEALAKHGIRAKAQEDGRAISAAKDDAGLVAALRSMMEKRMAESLEGLPMRSERERSIRRAIDAILEDADFIIKGKTELGDKTEAANLMMNIFHMLLLQDSEDIKLPFVPHSILHTNNVRNEVKSAIDNSRVVRDALVRTYGDLRTGTSLALLSAWLHDLGYGVLTSASVEAGKLGYKSGKGYHAELGLDVAAFPVMADGSSIIDELRRLYGDASLQDIKVAVRDHGADKKSVTEDGAPASGKYRYLSASTDEHILTFLVRLADNLDADVYSRLYSYQNNPFFVFLLKSLQDVAPSARDKDELKDILKRVKADFTSNVAGYYKTAYVMYLVEQKRAAGSTESEESLRAWASKMADDDFKIISDNLAAYDDTNLPHFGGMLKAHEIRQVGGQLVIVAKLNTENRVIPEEVLAFQVERMKEAFASLRAGGMEIAVTIEKGAAEAPRAAEMNREMDILKGAIDALPEGSAQKTLLEAVLEYAMANPDVRVLGDVTDKGSGAKIVEQGAMEDSGLYDNRDGLGKVYILTSIKGTLQISKDGKVVKEIAEPTLIGEMSLLLGDRTATVTVSPGSEAQCIEMSGERFRELLRYPHFVVAYAALVAQRDREAKAAVAAREAGAMAAPSALQPVSVASRLITTFKKTIPHIISASLIVLVPGLGTLFVVGLHTTVEIGVASMILSFFVTVPLAWNLGVMVETNLFNYLRSTRYIAAYREGAKVTLHVTRNLNALRREGSPFQAIANDTMKAVSETLNRIKTDPAFAGIKYIEAVSPLLWSYDKAKGRDAANPLFARVVKRLGMGQITPRDTSFPFNMIGRLTMMSLKGFKGISVKNISEIFSPSPLREGVLTIDISASDKIAGLERSLAGEDVSAAPAAVPPAAAAQPAEVKAAAVPAVEAARREAAPSGYTGAAFAKLLMWAIPAGLMLLSATPARAGGMGSTIDMYRPSSMLRQTIISAGEAFLSFIEAVGPWALAVLVPIIVIAVAKQRIDRYRETPREAVDEEAVVREMASRLPGQDRRERNLEIARFVAGRIAKENISLQDLKRAQRQAENVDFYSMRRGAPAERFIIKLGDAVYGKFMRYEGDPGRIFTDKIEDMAQRGKIDRVLEIIGAYIRSAESARAPPAVTGSFIGSGTKAAKILMFGLLGWGAMAMSSSAEMVASPGGGYALAGLESANPVRLVEPLVNFVQSHTVGLSVFAAALGVIVIAYFANKILTGSRERAAAVGHGEAALHDTRLVVELPDRIRKAMNAEDLNAACDLEAERQSILEREKERRPGYEDPSIGTARSLERAIEGLKIEARDAGVEIGVRTVARLSDSGETEKSDAPDYTAARRAVDQKKAAGRIGELKRMLDEEGDIGTPATELREEIKGLLRGREGDGWEVLRSDYEGQIARLDAMRVERQALAREGERLGVLVYGMPYGEAKRAVEAARGSPLASAAAEPSALTLPSTRAFAERLFGEGFADRHPILTGLFAAAFPWEVLLSYIAPLTFLRSHPGHTGAQKAGVIAIQSVQWLTLFGLLAFTDASGVTSILASIAANIITHALYNMGSYAFRLAPLTLGGGEAGVAPVSAVSKADKDLPDPRLEGLAVIEMVSKTPLRDIERLNESRRISPVDRYSSERLFGGVTIITDMLRYAPKDIASAMSYNKDPEGAEIMIIGAGRDAAEVLALIRSFPYKIKAVHIVDIDPQNLVNIDSELRGMSGLPKIYGYNRDISRLTDDAPASGRLTGKIDFVYESNVVDGGYGFVYSEIQDQMLMVLKPGGVYAGLSDGGRSISALAERSGKGSPFVHIADGMVMKAPAILPAAVQSVGRYSPEEVAAIRSFDAKLAEFMAAYETAGADPAKIDRCVQLAAEISGMLTANALAGKSASLYDFYDRFRRRGISGKEGTVDITGKAMPVTYGRPAPDSSVSSADFEGFMKDLYDVVKKAHVMVASTLAQYPAAAAAPSAVARLDAALGKTAGMVTDAAELCNGDRAMIMELAARIARSRVAEGVSATQESVAGEIGDARKTGEKVYLVSDGKDVVGSVTVTAPQDGTSRLRFIAVSTANRDKGLGTRLVRSAVEYAIANGARTLTVTTSSGALERIISRLMRAKDPDDPDRKWYLERRLDSSPIKPMAGELRTITWDIVRGPGEAPGEAAKIAEQSAAEITPSASKMPPTAAPAIVPASITGGNVEIVTPDTRVTIKPLSQKHRQVLDAVEAIRRELVAANPGDVDGVNRAMRIGIGGGYVRSLWYDAPLSDIGIVLPSSNYVQAIWKGLTEKTGLGVDLIYESSDRNDPLKDLRDMSDFTINKNIFYLDKIDSLGGAYRMRMEEVNPGGFEALKSKVLTLTHDPSVDSTPVKKIRRFTRALRFMATIEGLRADAATDAYLKSIVRDIYKIKSDLEAAGRDKETVHDYFNIAGYWVQIDRMREQLEKLDAKARLNSDAVIKMYGFGEFMRFMDEMRSLIMAKVKPPEAPANRYRKDYKPGTYRTVVGVKEGAVAVAEYSDSGIVTGTEQLVAAGKEVSVVGVVGAVKRKTETAETKALKALLDGAYPGYVASVEPVANAAGKTTMCVVKFANGPAELRLNISISAPQAQKAVGEHINRFVNIKRQLAAYMMVKSAGLTAASFADEAGSRALTEIARRLQDDAMRNGKIEKGDAGMRRSAVLEGVEAMPAQFGVLKDGGRSAAEFLRVGENGDWTQKLSDLNDGRTLPGMGIEPVKVSAEAFMEPMYATAANIAPSIVAAVNRDARTFITAPANEDEIVKDANIDKGVERVLGKSGHLVTANHYALEKGIADLKEKMSKNDMAMIKEFMKAVNRSPTTRWAIRVLSERDREEIIRFLDDSLMGLNNRDRAAVALAMSKIRVMVVGTAKAQRMNPVVDLFVDFGMMELDRYGKPGEYAGSPSDAFKRDVARLLRESTTNFEDADGNNILQKINEIFSGKEMRIRAVDWKSFQDWKKHQDAVLSAV